MIQFLAKCARHRIPIIGNFGAANPPGAARVIAALAMRAGIPGLRIAYDRAAYPVLAEQVTAERVHGLFRHRGATGVRRYELPLPAALNLVIDDVLEGGVKAASTSTATARRTRSGCS